MDLLESIQTKASIDSFPSPGGVLVVDFEKADFSHDASRIYYFRIEGDGDVHSVGKHDDRVHRGP